MKFNFFVFTCLVVISVMASAQSAWTPIGKYGNPIFKYSIVLDTIRVAPYLNSAIETEHDHGFDIEHQWKSWTTVQNFTYGKDRGALPMITDLQSLHPYLRDRIYDLIKECREQGIELAIVESFRTHAKQNEYFSMGKKYTRTAGGKSKHQYGLAVDVVPVVNSVPQWDNTVLWKKVGAIGEKLGLRWGGRWRSPYDPAHFEWSGGMKGVELATGTYPSIPETHSTHYPCIQDDIQLLRKYWSAWEIEQSLMATKSKNTQEPSVVSSN